MRIKKETFIENFIQTAIAHHENYDVTYNAMDYTQEDRDKFRASKKLSNKLSDKLQKMSDFLAKDPIFAKETLDKLVEISDKNGANHYVMACTAGRLWEFNYRTDDFHRLYKKSFSLMGESLSKTVGESFYESMCDGSLKRRREFPKLD